MLTTDRKKEIDYISTKIDQFKKGIDKKINDNMKTIIDDLKVKNEMTPSSSRKTIDNDRTIETSKMRTHSDISETISYPKTQRKFDTSGRKVDTIKTMLNVSEIILFTF